MKPTCPIYGSINSFSNYCGIGPFEWTQNVFCEKRHVYSHNFHALPCVIVVLTVVFLFFVGKYWCPYYSDTLLLMLSGKSAGQMANMELYI